VISQKEGAMPKQPATEFWRSVQPIAKPIKPDAPPEIFHQCAPVDDDRYYVPFSETVGSRPLWISIKDNMGADILRATSAGLVNRHYHPHEGRSGSGPTT
jgi:2,4'-dihydroxyacetophenone dioxygenase